MKTSLKRVLLFSVILALLLASCNLPRPNGVKSIPQTGSNQTEVNTQSPQVLETSAPVLTTEAPPQETAAATETVQPTVNPTATEKKLLSPI